MKLSDIFIALTLVSVTTGYAIQIDGHTASTNDRFANHASFTADGYKLTGVGRATTGTAGKGGHWATMISRNVFITATHYHAAVGQDLYFYDENDPSATPFSSKIVGGQRIGTTDLWVGYINDPIPSGINYYDWISDSHNAASYAVSTLAFEEALVSGITPTSGTYGGDRKTNQAVGRNIIDGFDPALTVDSSTNAALITTKNNSGDLNYVTYESQLVSGDSGAPLFIDNGGELQLVGINWAVGLVDIDPTPLQVIREASFYSYVGNYSAQIQSYVDAHPVAVPEPSQLALLGVATLFGFRRKK